MVRKSGVCPFLGLSDDPGTALGYPSTGNYCHHVKPVTSVGNSHQARYCLGGDYEACKVYQAKGDQPLPREFERRKFRITGRHARLIVVSVLVFVAAVVIIAVAASAAKPGESTLSEQEINLQALQTITQMVHLTQSSAAILSTPTQTPEPMPTSTVHPATAFPTEYSAHQLEVPFGANPRFLIHKVNAGESFLRYSQEYNTTREAIIAVNYGYSQLWADSILVIPLDVTDAAGLPAFTAFQVTEPNLTVASVAANQGVDLDLIMKYNDLPSGYIFLPEEWVLLPH